MTCIKTGCGVWDPVHKRALWGDLFCLSGALVLNGVVVNDGRPSWQYRDEPKESEPYLILLETSRISPSFWERRGVMVILFARATEALKDCVAPISPEFDEILTDMAFMARVD